MIAATERHFRTVFTITRTFPQWLRSANFARGQTFHGILLTRRGVYWI